VKHLSFVGVPAVSVVAFRIALILAVALAAIESARI
jgi:hypothetical protein